MTTTTCRAVIFDMDGTLLESTEADFLAWKALFAEHGIDLTFENYFPLLGKKSADVVHGVLNLHGNAATDALARKLHFFNQIVDDKGIQKIPFAEELLRQIKQIGLPIGLATSSRKPKTQKVLQQTGLAAYFDTIVTGEEVDNGKPAPDIFLKAARRLNVDPANCLAFEDAASGIQAARAAGMTCVAIVSTHQRQHLHHANIILDSFENISFPALLQSLNMGI